MNNKIQEIRDELEEIKKEPVAIWGWEEKSIEYLLSEYDRLQSENERFRQALDKICAKANEDRMSNVAFEALHEDGEEK